MIRRTLNLGRLGRPLFVRRQRGFSLIEVLMSVVLMGIGMALALPSYRDMVEKRQVTNGAEQVASFINTAQGVAMKTNQVVTISYAPLTEEDQWCIGATIGETACDCNVTDPSADDFCGIEPYCKVAPPPETCLDRDPLVLSNGHMADPLLVHSIADNGDYHYAFDPIRGLFMDLDDSLTMELRSQSDDFRLNVMVNNTGRVTLCSSSADHPVPGYAVCNVPQLEVGPEIPGEGIGPVEEPSPLPEAME